MKRFAQIDNGVVTGILVTKDIPTVLPPGRSFVELNADDQTVGGATYDGKIFTPPGPRIVAVDEALTEVKAFRADMRTALQQLFGDLTVIKTKVGVPAGPPNANKPTP